MQNDIHFLLSKLKFSIRKGSVEAYSFPVFENTETDMQSVEELQKDL